MIHKQTRMITSNSAHRKLKQQKCITCSDSTYNEIRLAACSQYAITGYIMMIDSKSQGRKGDIWVITFQFQSGASSDKVFVIRYESVSVEIRDFVSSVLSVLGSGLSSFRIKEEVHITRPAYLTFPPLALTCPESLESSDSSEGSRLYLDRRLYVERDIVGVWLTLALP